MMKHLVLRKHVKTLFVHAEGTIDKKSVGAEEGTRTPTAFRPPAPKAGASANSATSARTDSITSGEPWN